MSCGRGSMVDRVRKAGERLVGLLAVLTIALFGQPAMQARSETRTMRPLLASHDSSTGGMVEAAGASLNQGSYTKERSSTVTEASQGETELIIHSTAELVLAVADLREELEAIRTQLVLSRTIRDGSLAKSSRETDACLACTVNPEWQRLPLGPIASIEVRGALCRDAAQTSASSTKDSPCIAPGMFNAQIAAALDRPLSALERVSCTFLSKALAIPNACPTKIGAFYDCSLECSE